MNHLIDFGVCALVGCIHHTFYTITFKRYFKCILGVQILIYIVRAQLLGERLKGKNSTAKQLRGQEGLKLYYNYENVIFLDEFTL